MTRVIVAGSRYFNNKTLMFKKLDEVMQTLSAPVEIVSGHCRGADILGEEYARKNNIPLITFPADWNKYGKRAGYIRNKQMAEYAQKDNGILVAFPMGESRGTMMMIAIAKAYHLQCVVISAENNNVTKSMQNITQ